MNKLKAYRSSAAEGATHLGLLLAVYDAIAEDLRLTRAAVQRGNIQDRCRHSEHVLLLLGHLESWLPLLDDAKLKDSLAAFYGYIRSELIRLQAKPDPAGFEALAWSICETRAVWQRKQSASTGQIPNSAPADGPERPREVRLSLSA